MDRSELDTANESPDSTVAVEEQPVAAPEAATESGSETAAESASGAAATTGRPDPTRGFLTELAHAMRGAAERERERISAEVDAAAEAHVEKVRARAATEAAELRRLAEDDIDGIHAWSKEETIRIREETERRIGDATRGAPGLPDPPRLDHRRRGRSHRRRRSRLPGRARRASSTGWRPSPTRPGSRDVADEMPAPPDLGKVGGAARAQAVAALAEEEDAADAGVADGVASAAANGESAANAFDPARPGPELVPVMGQANGTANATAVVASVVASGDQPTAETEGEASDPATEHPNVAVRLLRSIASSLSAPAEHPADASEPAATTEAVTAEAAAQVEAPAPADEAKD